MHKSIYFYDRKTLYKEVWAEPMIIVSKRYGLSNVGLKKVCQKLNIPTPGNGYWSKVKAGYEVQKPELPKVKVPQIPKQSDDYQPDNYFFKDFDSHYSEFNEKHKFEELKSEALDWELATTIREYIQAVETKLLMSEIPAKEKILIKKRIRWAKRKADWLDPLIAEKDPILRKRRHTRVFFVDE